MNRMSVFKWCLEFQNHHTSVHDDQRSGRPSIVTVILKLRSISAKRNNHRNPRISEIVREWIPKQLTDQHKLNRVEAGPLYPLYMRWGVTKLQVADLAGAQSKKSLSAIEQPSTSADSSIIEDTRVHDSLENNVNILETKEAEKEIDAEAEPSLEERSIFRFSKIIEC
ncbi:hypothetical protein J6590_033178 [Homalodisca vitripennis]|nr:hypothetical protein J6590_033178 [Homalodisca vitripennis]